MTAAREVMGSAYMHWAKTRSVAKYNLATSGLGNVKLSELEVSLDDLEITDGTIRYIRENHLSAPRAFEWRMLEMQNMLRRRESAMVLDRLNDLQDLELRLLNRMLGHPDPSVASFDGAPVIIVAALAIVSPSSQSCLIWS